MKRTNEGVKSRKYPISVFFIYCIRRILILFSYIYRDDFVYDFDLMMAKKKEESYHRRKRKNIDIINDNDDIIAELVTQMKQSADVSTLFLSDISIILTQICISFIFSG